MYIYNIVNLLIVFLLHNIFWLWIFNNTNACVDKRTWHSMAHAHAAIQMLHWEEHSIQNWCWAPTKLPSMACKAYARASQLPSSTQSSRGIIQNLICFLPWILCWVWSTPCHPLFLTFVPVNQHPPALAGTSSINDSAFVQDGNGLTIWGEWRHGCLHVALLL